MWFAFYLKQYCGYCLLWYELCYYCYFFFFSSRRRHTRLVSDWSSDVCSSDLPLGDVHGRAPGCRGARRRRARVRRRPAARGRRHIARGLSRRDRSLGRRGRARFRPHRVAEGARAPAGPRAGRRLRADGRASQNAVRARAVLRPGELPRRDHQAPADQHARGLPAVRARDAARSDRARGRGRGALASARRDAPSRGGVGRAARRRLPAAGRAAQLDRVVSQAARRKERQADRRGAETGGLDHRLGIRPAEGVHHPHRAHGRPHRRRAGPAPGPARRARDVTYRVAVADKVAEAGLKLLAETPEIEVANCAGKPREELERALAGAHALVVRSETRVTADLLTRGPNLRVIARAGTGVDNIDVHAATRRGIAVMNAPGANTVSA